MGGLVLLHSNLDGKLITNMRITSVSNHVSRPSQAPGKAPEKEESLRVVPQFDASLDYTKKHFVSGLYHQKLSTRKATAFIR
jgi:hypothetical protein